MLSRSLLTALAGDIGGTNAQVQMMGKAGSLLGEPPEDAPEDVPEDKIEEAVKEAKIKAAASLLNEVLNDS